MATENIRQIVSRQAGTGVINKRFVLEVAGGIVNLVTVSGGNAHGVVALRSGMTGTAIVAGDECPVAKSPGDVIVESGAAVADAVQVMSDTTGRAILFVPGAGTLALGRVVNGASASAAGQDLSIELYTNPIAIA